KNISDTIKKLSDISNVSDNTHIGNVNRYSQYSLPGVYKTAPKLAIDLYTGGSNPLLAYNTTTYNSIFEGVLSVTGKDALYSNQRDVIVNNIKQFVYSNYINNIGSNLDTIKDELLYS